MLCPGEVHSYACSSSILSWPCSKTGKTSRSLRVNGLFGGNKENNEKSDDTPSKVQISIPGLVYH